MNEKIEDVMRDKLTASLAPARLVIENESHLHHGHASSPQTGESHFRLEIVSDRFDGLSRVERQRLVYQILAQELAGPVHALSLSTRTPTEAQKADAPAS